MKTRSIFVFFLSLFAYAAQAQEPVVLSQNDLNTIYGNYFGNAVPRRVTVHDPSVVIGYESDGKVTGVEVPGSKKVYCIFGSHRAWAKSYDLINWTTFTNNISTSYSTIFAADAQWSKRGSSSYDVGGNLWAPDVIWNPSMNKWCMYMSVNGDKWYSQIVLLTAESLTGNWTRVGTVVYSGFVDDATARLTDLYDVLGTSTFPARYLINRNGNRTYSMNCIDPCTFFDEDGVMRMVYGSWFGGLYMINLDPSTGLRDMSVKYPTLPSESGNSEEATSDAYQGIKVAGGSHRSGEAPYVEYFKGRYYLFVTYGGLEAKGGYNMRVFSSANPEGPFVDLSGNDARFSSGNSSVGDVKGTVGTRLMSYYKWSFMQKGFCAQGHNSAVVDTDGRMFLVYHTRFNDGTEGHQVRVHQLFACGNGGLTAAPFEFTGETLAEEAYPTEAVVGRYGVMLHNNTNYSSLECVQEKRIELTADGLVTGDFTGTWSQSPSSPEIVIKVGGTDYYGVLIEQNIEETRVKTLCFTGVGVSDYSLWGYKLKSNGQPFDDDAVVVLNSRQTSPIPQRVLSGSQLNLPTEGLYGAVYEWASLSPEVITDGGKVLDVNADTDVRLQLTISSGNISTVIEKTITVQPSSALMQNLPFAASNMLGYYVTGTEFNNVAPKFDISEKTGVSISFNINGLTDDWTTVAHSSDDAYKLYLSILHLGQSDHYEATAVMSEAAKKTGTDAWRLFLNGSYYATVSYNTDGSITFYRNGILMLTYNPDTKCSWSQNASTAMTPAQIVKRVISYFKVGRVSFLHNNISNVVVGYAADYVNPSALRDATADSVRIHSYGNVIAIDGKAAAEQVVVYSAAGCEVARTTESRIPMRAKGIYIVRCGAKSQTVKVK